MVNLVIHHQTTAAAVVLVTVGEKYTALNSSFRRNSSTKSTASTMARAAETGTITTA